MPATLWAQKRLAPLEVPSGEMQRNERDDVQNENRELVESVEKIIAADQLGAIHWKESGLKTVEGLFPERKHAEPEKQDAVVEHRRLEEHRF